MYADPIQSNLDNITRDFIESLIAFNKPFYERLREYTINVIGSGNLGRPFILALTSEIAKPRSMIKQVNWFTREHMNRAGELKTKELQRALENHTNNRLRDRNGRNGDIYDKILSKVRPIGYTDLDELREMIFNSVSKDNEKEADLTVILANYNMDFLFNIRDDKSNKEKIFAAKTYQEIKNSMKETDILLNAMTLNYKRSEGIDECIQALMDTQDLTIRLNMATREFCDMKHLSPSRLQLLPASLIGNMALAKAMEEYPGTVINMTNPVEIINQQFAYHSKMPANRIFSPVENDYCRLSSIIRETYNQVFGKRFEGTIRCPVIYGPHNEQMTTMSSENILFDDISFAAKFKGHKPDELFEKIKARWRDYGTDHVVKYNEVAPDTVMNSLVPATMMMIYEQNNYPIRGCVYSSDHKIFTGADFHIKRGHAISANISDIAKLDPESMTQVMKAIGFDRDLTMHLSNIDGITGLKITEPAKVPEVDSEHVVSAKEYITRTAKDAIAHDIRRMEQIAEDIKKNGKTDVIVTRLPALDFSVYLRSSEDRHVINKYRFNNGLSPEFTPFKIVIPDMDAVRGNNELDKTQINGFAAQNGKMVIVTERGHSNSIDYRIIEYADTRQESYRSVKLLNNDMIEKFTLNDRIYLLMRQKGKQNISVFDGKIRPLCETPEELIGIMPYKDTILGFSADSYFVLEDRLRILYKGAQENDNTVMVDSNNDILYYVIDSDNIHTKEIMARDLNADRQRIFRSSSRNCFGQYSDNNGVQLAIAMDNKLVGYDFDGKDALLSGEPRSQSSAELNPLKTGIYVPQRDIIVMDNNSTFKIGFVDKGKIMILPVDRIDRYRPGGIFV